MLVGVQHVLTCAHIFHDASASDVEVIVDLVGLPGRPSIGARIEPDGWAPAIGKGSGDVALLKLHRPVAEGAGARLRRKSMTRERAVYLYGFSEALENGVVVQGTLVPHSPGGERVQLNTSAGPRVRPGFSGAAVVDEATGDVLGMLVSFYADAAAGVSWMIPVETIINYLPIVDRWVPGASSIDPGFVAAGHRRGGELAQQLADFFAWRAGGNVMIVVTGPAGSARSAALRRAAVLSNRQLRPLGGRASANPDEDPSIPPLGSIDLALDASGKTVRELVRRILDWAGAPGDEPPGTGTGLVGEAAPRTLIIDNIDKAADSEAVLADVVQPIVRRAAERDMRVVLAFQDESIHHRLALLEQRISQVTDEWAAVRGLLRRIVDRVPERALPSAGTLALRLAVLREAVRHAPEDAAVPLDEFASCERDADLALREMVAARQEFAARLAERDELRGLLTAYASRAAILGEDPPLGDLYRQAHELLWVAPCDLEAATAALERYAGEVRRRTGTPGLSSGVGR